MNPNAPDSHGKERLRASGALLFSHWRKNHISIQFFNLLQKFSVLWHALLNITDNAVLIDQVGYPAAVVQFPDCIIFVNYEREGDAVLFGKFFVGLNGVGTHTQDLGVQTFKALDVFLKGLQFPFSDRGEISKIKGEHHVFLAAKILETDRPLV